MECKKFEEPPPPPGHLLATFCVPCCRFAVSYLEQIYASSKEHTSIGESNAHS
jgi:hypothetical protein